jgi:hypothetical protein
LHHPHKSTGWADQSKNPKTEGPQARDLGILRALTQLVAPITSNPGLDEGHQIDFIETFESLDLASHILHFLKAIQERDEKYQQNVRFGKREALSSHRRKRGCGRDSIS